MSPALTEPASLFVGRTMHERHLPRRNAFRYGIYFVYLDIDRVDEVAAKVRLFAHNRFSLFSLHDMDHGPRDGSALRPWIDDVLASAEIDLHGGSVHLLTFPRVLGFRFFPASFWYCYDNNGVPRAVLAEVNNTFHEHHNYLLHDCGRPYDWKRAPEVTKVFHVSPFIEMDARYEFHISEPGESASIVIRDYVKESLLLVASIGLRRRVLTDGALLKALLRFGPMSARAWALIHFQALRIVAKRIRYIPRPALPEEETTST